MHDRLVEQRAGGARAGDGHRDHEGRALVGKAADLNRAAVFLYDAVAQTQTQPGTFAGFFGGGEWVEDAVEVFRRNAGAVVADGNFGVRRRRARCDTNPAVVPVSFDGLPGVVEDVDDDLLELMLVRDDGR